MISYHTVINGIDVCAQYTEESVRNIFLPLLCRFSALREAKNRRILVMLAAPPGAGKSTLADFLRTLSLHEPDVMPVTVIGMDGFHRYQDDLAAHTVIRDGREVSLVQIKGAPVTFDLPRLTEYIRKVAAGLQCGWPEYNRMLHNPTEDAIKVTGDIVLLEGNYLLLDRDGWRELAGFADYTIRITADEAMLQKRLVRRKIQSGTEPEPAARFVEFSDMANVRECLEHTKKADLTLILQEDGSYTLSRESARLMTPMP